jgi:hypothetical protein
MHGLTLPGQCYAIKKNWKFLISHNREKVFGLDSNIWVVYSIRLISTNNVCPSADTLLPIQIRSSQVIKLQSGCHIRTLDHVYTANDAEDIEGHSKCLYWTWSLGEQFNYQDDENATADFQELHTKIYGEFPHR